MFTRLVLIFTGLAAFAAASPQSPASAQAAPPHSAEKCNCPPLKLQPFTGHVFDAETGKPIAGAEVHYLDNNPPVDQNNRPVRDMISGSVSTAADGSYQIPTTLPLATYHISISAPGYYAGVFYDSPLIVGERPDNKFPHPSHEIRLLPSSGLLAIGSSQFSGLSADAHSSDSITAASFATGGNSLAVAAPGPGLWIISIPDGHVRPIELPSQLTAPGTVIGNIGWDGNNLVFTANSNDVHTYIGGASAPDFHVSLLPAPDPQQTAITIGRPYADADGFTFEQTTDCDQKNDSPHCGWGGNIIARNSDTGRTTTVFSAWVGDLSYLHDSISGGIVIFAEETQRPAMPGEPMDSGHRLIPGITLLNLTTHRRSHIVLPGTYGRHLTFVADSHIPELAVKALRIAYTIQGDCDPGSTVAAQPFAPGGRSGFTPNNWSVCVVTIPLPPDPAPPPHRASAAKK